MGLDWLIPDFVDAPSKHRHETLPSARTGAVSSAMTRNHPEDFGVLLAQRDSRRPAHPGQRAELAEEEHEEAETGEGPPHALREWQWTDSPAKPSMGAPTCVVAPIPAKQSPPSCHAIPVNQKTLSPKLTSTTLLPPLPPPNYLQSKLRPPNQQGVSNGTHNYKKQTINLLQPINQAICNPGVELFESQKPWWNGGSGRAEGEKGLPPCLKATTFEM